jgi:hypothetical protein
LNRLVEAGYLSRHAGSSGRADTYRRSTPNRSAEGQS